MKFTGQTCGTMYFIPEHRRLEGRVKACTMFRILSSEDNKTIRKVAAWGRLALRVAKTLPPGTFVTFEGREEHYLGRVFELGKTKPIVDWNGEDLRMPRTTIFMTELIGQNIPPHVKIITSNKEVV